MRLLTIHAVLGWMALMGLLPLMPTRVAGLLGPAYVPVMPEAQAPRAPQGVRHEDFTCHCEVSNVYLLREGVRPKGEDE
jgi:hypothetical protein